MEVRPHSAILGRMITFLVMIVVFAGTALAGTSIVGSKHDFSMSATASPFAGQFMTDAPGFPIIEEICVFCHTPHGASTDTQTNTLLWNRVSSPPTGYTYKTYSSGSMTNPAPDSLNTNKPTGISMMCMSCHDGVTSVAVNTLLNAPGSGNPQVSIDTFSTLPSPGAIGNIYNGGLAGWSANIGNARPGIDTIIDLSNDHPISFEYPSGKAGLQASPTDASLRLFGATGKRMECATCHLVHNPSREPFLAMDNTQSLMCRACHII